MSGLNTASANNYEASGVHIYDFRYAELQLNLAECYAATNQIDLCKQAIGKLRARVGIPSTNNYGLDTYVFDRASALAACLRDARSNWHMKAKDIGIFGVGCFMMEDGEKLCS